MANNKDLYKILQVDPSAEPEVISAAYRRLALKYHPDQNRSADAAIRMQDLNEAYSTLSNLDKRAQYDRERVPAPSANHSKEKSEQSNEAESYRPATEEPKQRKQSEENQRRDSQIKRDQDSTKQQPNYSYQNYSNKKNSTSQPNSNHNSVLLYLFIIVGILVLLGLAYQSRAINPTSPNKNPVSGGFVVKGGTGVNYNLSSVGPYLLSLTNNASKTQWVGVLVTLRFVDGSTCYGNALGSDIFHEGGIEIPANSKYSKASRIVYCSGSSASKAMNFTIEKCSLVVADIPIAVGRNHNKSVKEDYVIYRNGDSNFLKEISTWATIKPCSGYE